jgi:hypothetical protein
MILLASLMLFSINILPFFFVILARRRAVRLLFGVDVLAVVAMYAYAPRASGSTLSPPYAALHPFGIGIFIYGAQVRLGNGGEGRHRVAGHLLPLAPLQAG